MKKRQEEIPKSVRCSVCRSESDGRCVIKKEKVTLNKTRKCEFFEKEFDKVQVVMELESEYIPWHLRDKNARKKHFAENEKKGALKEVTNPDILKAFRG